MSSYAQLLSNRQILSISGQDAASFLQSLITNDIYQITESTLLYTAILNSKGRYMYDFFIIKKENEYLLDIPKSKTDNILRFFSLYKLRAKVGIKKAEDSYGVLAIWGEKIQRKESYFYQDPRVKTLGFRVYNFKETLAPLLSDYKEGDYLYNSFLEGVPDCENGLIQEKTIPLEANLDQLNAISFNKGCYIGQELTARTHHQGLIRKRILPFHLEAVSPVETHLLTDNNINLGTIVARYKDLGLARIRLEALKPTKGNCCVFIPKWLSI